MAAAGPVSPPPWPLGRSFDGRGHADGLLGPRVPAAHGEAADLGGRGQRRGELDQVRRERAARGGRARLGGALLLRGQPRPVGQLERADRHPVAAVRRGLEVQGLGSGDRVAGHVAVVVDALGPLHQERRVVLVLLHDQLVLRAGLVGNADLHVVGGALGDLLGDLPVGLVPVEDLLAGARLAVLELLHPVGAADPDRRRAGLREGGAQRGDRPGCHRDQLARVAQLDGHEAADPEHLGVSPPTRST